MTFFEGFIIYWIIAFWVGVWGFVREKEFQKENPHAWGHDKNGYLLNSVLWPIALLCEVIFPILFWIPSMFFKYAVKVVGDFLYKNIHK